MGNHGSFPKSSLAGDENLLRRNVRHSGYPFGDEGRTNRSRSLEPHATQEIHVVEHSKSARYTRKKNSQQRAWDPNDSRLLALSRYRNEATAAGFGETGRSASPSGFEKSCITGMTRHQKIILQKIWIRASDADKTDCSRNILSHLLRSNAQLYDVFGLNGMTDKEIVNSNKFARLSSNFGMVFDFVITNFDDLQRVAFALECLGAHHANLGFPIASPLWSLFTRVFEDNPPKLVFQNPEGHSVWKLMCNFVIRQMHNGYAKELENPQRKNSNTLHVDRAF